MSTRTDLLVALLQRAKSRHWSRMTYAEALHCVAGNVDLGLLPMAEEIVREARRSCGARGGPTNPRHWDEAIRIAQALPVEEGVS